MDEIIVLVASVGAVFIGLMQYTKKLIENNDADRKACAEEKEKLTSENLRLRQAVSYYRNLAIKCKRQAKTEYEINQRLLTTLSKSATIVETNNTQELSNVKNSSKQQ